MNPYRKNGLQQMTRIPPYRPGQWVEWNSNPFEVEWIEGAFTREDQELCEWTVKLVGHDEPVPWKHITRTLSDDERPKSADNAAAHIKRERLARDWSQGELARRVGVSQTWICQLEYGGTEPSFDLGRKLANTLGIPFGALVGIPKSRDVLVEMIRNFDLGLEEPQPYEVITLAAYFCWPAEKLIVDLTGYSTDGVSACVERLKAAEVLTATGVEVEWLQEEAGTLVFFLDAMVAKGDVRRTRDAEGEWVYQSLIYKPPAPKNPDAVALGKLGGPKGGRARARALSPARRREIAQQAAAKRWGGK